MNFLLDFYEIFTNLKYNFKNNNMKKVINKPLNFDTRECDLRISNEERLFLDICKNFNDRVNFQTPENLGRLNLIVHFLLKDYGLQKYVNIDNVDLSYISWVLTDLTDNKIAKNIFS